MSKEHQFIIKSIINGNRSPMYLETYTLGDCSSLVFQEAMKLLNREDSIQEVSVEAAIEYGKEYQGELCSTANTGKVNEPSCIHRDLRMQDSRTFTTAPIIDDSCGGQFGYSNLGHHLANDINRDFPKKNWKGKVNKALEIYGEPNSPYSQIDIAFCVLSFHPSHAIEDKYREILALDFPKTAQGVYDILKADYDRITSFKCAEKIPSTLRMDLSPNDDVKLDGLVKQFTSDDTCRHLNAGVLQKDETINDNFDATIIPLEGGIHAWVKTTVLNALVIASVDENWPATKLRRKVENLFNQPAGNTWYTVVSGWFNTAMEVERANRTLDKAPASTIIKQLCESRLPKVMSDQDIIDAIHLLYAKGMLDHEDTVSALFELLGYPGNYDAFIVAERPHAIPQELRAMCIARFGMTEELTPSPDVDPIVTHEITSVTQTAYYRNGKFDDYVVFGSAPGSRAQNEIIGVLAYEMDETTAEPDCVSIMHYQFFYQGDSVFVTDRYGNTVDRLR